MEPDAPGADVFVVVRSAGRPRGGDRGGRGRGRASLRRDPLGSAMCAFGGAADPAGCRPGRRLARLPGPDRRRVARRRGGRAGDVGDRTRSASPSGAQSARTRPSSTSWWRSSGGWNARSLMFYAGWAAQDRPEELALAPTRGVPQRGRRGARPCDARPDLRARRHRGHLGARRAALLPPRAALAAAAGRHGGRVGAGRRRAVRAGGGRQPTPCASGPRPSPLPRCRRGIASRSASTRRSRERVEAAGLEIRESDPVPWGWLTAVHDPGLVARIQTGAVPSARSGRSGCRRGSTGAGGPRAPFGGRHGGRRALRPRARRGHEPRRRHAPCRPGVRARVLPVQRRRGRAHPDARREAHPARPGGGLRRPPGGRHGRPARARPRGLHALPARRSQLPVPAHPVRTRR